MGHASIFFRCSCITGRDGPKIWAVTKRVKSGSVAQKKSSDFLSDPDPSSVGDLSTDVDWDNEHLASPSNDPPAIHLLDLWPQLQTVWRQRLRVQILSTATTTTAHPPFTFSSCYNVGIAFLSHVKNPAFPEIFWPRVNRHNLSRSDFFALISLLGLSEK